MLQYAESLKAQKKNDICIQNTAHETHIKDTLSGQIVK